MKLTQALLSEGSQSSRAYREIVDKFRKEDAEVIGYGDNGVVFDSGDIGWVYKVTSDEMELEDVEKASGKKFKYLANIGEYYIHPSGEAGWYQVENLRDAPREIYSALKDGGILFDFHKYVDTGDKKFLKDTPNIIKAGGREYSLHSFLTGVRTEMLSANIDTDNLDLSGGQNNIMMDSKGNLRLIDY